MSPARGSLRANRAVGKSGMALVLLLCSLAVGACSRTHRLYSGPVRPRDQVAVLVVAADGGDAAVQSVDGWKRPFYVREVELLPGPHQAVVGFRKSFSDYDGYSCWIRNFVSNADAKAQFVVRGGRDYRVRAEVCRGEPGEWVRSDRIPDSWWVALPTGQGIARWRAVVCDLETDGAMECDLETDGLVPARIEVPAGQGERQELLENSRGFALIQLAQHSEALTAFERAVELNPKNAEAWYGKGLALRCLSRAADALEALERALALMPGPDLAWRIWWEKGVVLLASNRHEEALACFERSLGLDDRFAASWWGKGAALGNLGRPREALVCFDRAIGIDSRYADAWWGKGLALSILGQAEEALPCVDRALSVAPCNQKIWMVKGGVLQRLNRYEEAKQAFGRAAELAR